VKRSSILLLALVGACSTTPPPQTAPSGEQRLLYVAAPGIRNYLEWGGAGILVYDIDRGHTLLRRIPVTYYDADDAAGKAPENVKGICASAATKRL